MTELEAIAAVPPLPTFDVAPLRVKIKSLAAEAKIIRQEEQRSKRRWKACRMRQQGSHASWHAGNFFHMREHRVGVVRAEARWAQLAMAFLRGKTYRSIEPAGGLAKAGWLQAMAIVHIVRIATKFHGPALSAEIVQAWLLAP